MKQAFLLLAITFSLAAKAQSPYIDATNKRLCANTHPYALSFFGVAQNITRVSIDDISIKDNTISGTIHLDYQIGMNWYSFEIPSNSFTVPLDNSLTGAQSQVALFMYLATFEIPNTGGLRLNITYQ